MVAVQIYFIFLISVVVLVAGCTSDSNAPVINAAKSVPIIQEFLADYPHAQMTAQLLDESGVGDDNDFVAHCTGVEAADYYKVTISDPASGLGAFVFVNQDEIPVCAFKESGTCIEDWSCGEWEPQLCPSTGSQTRTCIDVNDCGTTHSKPAETRSCTCEEDWTCGEWSACIGSTRTRECEDRNSCGTTDDKPATTTSCICTESWNCTEWGECSNNTQIRTCTDLNSCGTTENRPPLSQACQADECAVDSDCDDSDPSTQDVCTGTPKTCSHTPITECIDGDSYCPSGCDSITDSDCESVGYVECGENNESCFLQHLSDCSYATATFRVNFLDLFDIVTYYSINGVEALFCNMSYEITEHPDSDYLEKPAYCSIPLGDLETVSEDEEAFFDYIGPPNMFEICTGPYVDFTYGVLEGCVSGWANITINIGFYVNDKLVRLRAVEENESITVEVDGVEDSLEPLEIKIINELSVKNIEAHYSETVLERWAQVGFDCLE